MKIDLKYTHIIHQNTNGFRECFLDYSRQRTLYFFNIVKSVSCIESVFNELEYNLELQQSPFSSSSYFTIMDIKAKESFTIRISDHDCSEFDSSDFNIDSKTGEFYINISIIKLIKNYLKLK